MTLCIAAISRKDHKIVTVTDFLLSTDTTSLESAAAKVFPATGKRRWLVMYSGDPSTCQMVTTTARDHLKGTDESAHDVLTAFSKGFADELERKIECEILAPYGMTRAEFLKDGRGYLGDTAFNQILYAISNAKLGTDFLVAGFGVTGQPSIFSFSDPGTAYVHNATNIHVIGAGCELANASLITNFDPFDSLTDIIYRLCEAKFIGEAAPSVGQSTLVTVLDKDHKWTGIRPKNAWAIKNLWEKKGKPKVPSQAGQLITKHLDWDVTSDSGK